MMVQKYKNNTWGNVGPADFSGGEADSISLFVYNDGTSDGKPYVAYKDVYNSQKATVMEFDGTNWDPVGGTPGFTSGMAYYTSLYVYNNGTSDGIPYIAYDDFANGYKLSVMEFNGTNWVYVGGVPAISTGNPEYISIFVYDDGTSNGLPYVAYCDGSNSYKATVMKFDSTGWKIVGTSGFSAAQAFFISMQVYNDGTSTGIPYIAYEDYANNVSSTVMKFDGNNWINVGNAGFTNGYVSYTSLFLNSYGVPYVGMSDFNYSGNVSVMKYDCSQ